MSCRAITLLMGSVMGWRLSLGLVGPALGETKSDKLTEWQEVGWIC